MRVADAAARTIDPAGREDANQEPSLQDCGSVTATTSQPVTSGRVREPGACRSPPPNVFWRLQATWTPSVGPMLPVRIRSTAEMRHSGRLGTENLRA